MTAEGRGSILIVEDDAGMRLFLGEALRKEGYAPREAETGAAALGMISAERPDVVLLDVRLPDVDGLDLLRRVRAAAPDTLIVVMTAYGSRQMAHRAVEEGAYDYFEKPVDLADLRVVVRRAIERARLAREVRDLREQSASAEVPGMIGRSAGMLKTAGLVRLVAVHDIPVLIEGESGTGKELVARKIHEISPRNGRPFVAVNCAAIPETLLEAELFGYERGAFTGAVRAHEGRFEQAEGGTLFLDEIGDMSAGMQAKLLRTLQEKTVERIGSKASKKVDFRLVAATNQDLSASVRTGRFREDLYYRINAIVLRLPPLRDRGDDLRLLADRTIEVYGAKYGKEGLRLTNDAYGVLRSHSWPGNVRELENVLQRAILFAEGREVAPEHVALALSTSGGDERPEEGEEKTLLENVGEIAGSAEKEMIVEALTKARWRRQDAATLLGISRRTLLTKMKKYGLS
jgi:DNA-binding NtrC family response regulator